MGKKSRLKAQARAARERGDLLVRPAQEKDAAEYNSIMPLAIPKDEFHDLAKTLEEGAKYQAQVPES